MQFAEIWDRFFWSLLLFFFVTFVWLKFVDPYVAYMWSGVIVATIAGSIYFVVWWRKAQRELELQAED